jgi:hypothetical protein
VVPAPAWIATIDSDVPVESGQVCEITGLPRDYAINTAWLTAANAASGCTSAGTGAGPSTWPARSPASPHYPNRSPNPGPTTRQLEGPWSTRQTSPAGRAVGHSQPNSPPQTKINTRRATRSAATE